MPNGLYFTNSSFELETNSHYNIIDTQTINTYNIMFDGAGNQCMFISVFISLCNTEQQQKKNNTKCIINNL